MICVCLIELRKTLIIHVDDMMITTCDETHIDKVINEIENLYPGLTKYRGKLLNI